MNCRRHGSKPTLALWILVAALLVAATGPVTTLVVVVGLVAAVAGIWFWQHREAPQAHVRRRA